MYESQMSESRGPPVFTLLAIRVENT